MSSRKRFRKCRFESFSGSYPQGGGVGQHGSTGHGPHGPHGTGPTPPGKGQCDQMVHEPYFEIKSNEFVGNHIDCRQVLSGS